MNLVPLACVKNWERSMFDEMELNLSFKQKNTAGEKKMEARVDVFKVSRQSEPLLLTCDSAAQSLCFVLCFKVHHTS